MQKPNEPVQELAGLYGDKTFESIQELTTVSQLSAEEIQKIVDKIKNLVNC